MKVGSDHGRQSIYAEVTQRVIAELEEGRLPWVQPWDASGCECGMPRNGSTGRAAREQGDNLIYAAVGGVLFAFLLLIALIGVKSAFSLNA